MNINTRKYIEKYIKIRTKTSEIVPLKLNTAQEKLYNIIKKQKQEQKPVRIIILKARQLGFSTCTEAIFFKETATKMNVNTAIVAHKEESTTNLFNMTKLMYNELPYQLKPQLKASNAKELIFNTKENKGLNSKIKCMTAGGEGVGRSDTINNLHLSELAFWQGDKKQTLLGLLQAVPNNPNTMVIIESTANGYEYFKELWDNAVECKSDYIPLFIGWNELEEYQMPYDGFELTEEEEELQTLYHLTLEQLTWRRWCISNNCGGDIELFKQEYPINPQEAFISTGDCIFDKQQIINRIQKLKEPLKMGCFEYKTYYDTVENEVLIDNNSITWKEDKKGYIKIYKDVEKGCPYVIGGDTAGDGSDNFTGQALDNTTGEQVATLKHQFDEDLYAKQMYCLGIYYNQALVGVETNYSTYPNKELERLKYPNLYVRKKEDTYTHKTIKAHGFQTTKKTRPVIIAGLVEVFRDNIDSVNDKDTLEEALTFIRNEDGKAEAQNGKHDDLIMAKAIAHYIRPQQSYTKTITNEEKKINKENTFELNENDSNENEDYGSKIVII